MSTEAPTASQGARQALLTAIRNGVFGPGVRLPGERALAAQLSVSRETLRQALKQLAEDGVLHSSPQRGWFVASNMISEPPNVLQSFTDMARSRGLRPTSVVLDSSSRPATLEEAERLALAPTAPVLELRRLRCLDEIPIAVDHTVVALQRAPGLADVDLADASLYATLESVCGVQVVRSHYSVRASGAEPQIADLLRISPGDPVLVGEEVTYDISDAPILTGRLVYRGEAYQFQATLYRPSSGAPSPTA